MSIDWTHFTPWASLAGGLLVGLGAGLLVLGNGRIAGIAGIIGSPVRAVLFRTGLTRERTRLLFLLGMFAAPWAW